MGRAPGSTGRAPAHLSVLPGGIGASGGLEDLEEDRTTIEPAPDEAPTPIAASSTIEEQWEDGTTVAEQSNSSKRSAVVEESTIEDAARPLPPLALVPSAQPPDPAAAAKLVVIAGPDQGRVFDLRSGLEVRIGRAVDNDVVLTDIAVSRKHLALGWDGAAWVVHDNGSGNGTLINDRLEDGRCQLHHADRIEIGNTVLRFDHLPSAHQPSIAGWGQKEEEAATVAGKAPVRPSQVAAAVSEPPPRHRPASVTAPVRDRTPGPTRRRASGTEPPPPPPARGRPATVPPPVPRVTTAAAVAPPPAAGSQPPAPRAIAAAVPTPLTAAPSAPVAAPMSGPYTTPNPGPSAPAFSPFAGGARPMTTTAQVEPRAYQTVNPWTVVPPPRRRRTLWIGVGVAALVAAATAGALLGGGETKAPGASAAAPPDSAVAAADGSGSGSAVDVAPGPAPTTPDPTPVAPPPTPDPTAVAPRPAPPEVVAPTPTPPEVVAPTPTPPEPAVVKPPVVKPPVVKPPAPDRPVTPKPPPPDRPRITSPGRGLDIDTPTPKPPAAAATPKALAAATKKADGLYKAKDWKAAATTLRDAIGTSTDADAKALKSRAADYESIGTNLNAALAFGTSRAPEALAAYKKAMAADRRAGGAHQGFLRDKIADVAPRAAASYMAKQNYEMAKAAADDAVNVGAGGTPMIEGVRNSLDRRAGEFYATALKVQKSKPEDAKSLARRITKMVPSSSPWYAKAVKLLSASAGSGDEDE
jgi:hypothetical protein